MALVLIVDDDPSVLSLFKHGIENAGYDARVAVSGRDALHAIEHSRFDAIICDLCMPEISGLEVLRRVRDALFDTPFVMISGFATFDDAVAAGRLRAAGFLTKPVLLEDLVRTVAAAIDNHHCKEATTHAHGAERWAGLMAVVLPSASDPTTEAEWAYLAHKAVGTIRNCCRTLNIKAKRSLNLARTMRAWFNLVGKAMPYEQSLNAVDSRTIRKLLKHAGLLDRRPASVDEFLAGQSFVSDPAALHALKQALPARWREMNGHSSLHQNPATQPATAPANPREPDQTTRTKASRTPSQAKPSQAKPSQAKPNQTNLSAWTPWRSAPRLNVRRLVPRDWTQRPRHYSQCSTRVIEGINPG